MRRLFDEKYFAFGVNLPWLDGQYGHDFGKNEVFGFDIRAFDDKQKKTNLEIYLKDISEMGAHVVRLWLFEGYEGLEFDSNGYVKDIDDGLLKNIADVLNMTERYNLYLYICLIDTWGVNIHSQGRLSKLNLIISNEEASKSYIDNALKRFLCDSRIKTNRIFAIDVMNEPEGMYSSIWRRDIEWRDVIRFINESVDAIHSVNVKASCGFQRYHTLLDCKDNLKELDFYDFHEYNDDGDLQQYSSFGLDKPCIIGECGQKSEKNDDEIKDKAVKKFLDNSWKKGYAGCLIWYYNCRGYDVKDNNNRYSLITSDGRWRRACYALEEFNTKHKRNMLP